MVSAHSVKLVCVPTEKPKQYSIQQ